MNQARALNSGVFVLLVLIVCGCKDVRPQVICEQVSQTEMRCGHKGAVLP